MKQKIRKIAGSITAPRGFLAAGVFCDIKRLGTGKGSNKGPKRDLALILSESPATAAGMFTTSQVCAAPVKVSIPRANLGRARAIVVNSGNANACTGERGLRDAQAMTDIAAKLLGVPAAEVLVASTGRIGVTLPMPNVRRGIHAAAASLGSLRENAAQAAEAIMTSDTRPKEIAIELPLAGKVVRIGGICKGAGMIQPGMSATGARPAAAPGLHATMLGFITTDAAIERRALRTALAEAVAKSFNRITVDGDMSTNDTVIILANGLAGNGMLLSGARELGLFQAALDHVCLELAQMIVRDGEGTTRFVTVRIEGARSFTEADAAARAVANSSLVKTSWFGGDPNWGRILGALGYSRACVVEHKIDVAYSLPGGGKNLYALRRGQPARTSFDALCKIAAQKEFDLHIHLNLGRAGAVLYASDLTEEYVEFNKGDISDPAAMGG